MYRRIRTRSIILPTALALAGVWFFSDGSLPAPRKDGPPRYMGVKACKKCHQKKSIGSQYNVWKESAHAGAFKRLRTPEAVAVAKKSGVSGRPHEAAECLKCHVSSFGLPEDHYSRRFKAAEGVTCEGCHGPGEFFKKPRGGTRHEEAVGKGYAKPDEKTCERCHNQESPTWDPNRHTPASGEKVGFDFKSQYEKISHPIPAK